MLSSNLVSVYGAEEVEVSLVRYPSMNDQDLAVYHRRDRQEAEHVLEQLQNLTAMGLHTAMKTYISQSWTTQSEIAHSLPLADSQGSGQ